MTTWPPVLDTHPAGQAMIQQHGPFPGTVHGSVKWTHGTLLPDTLSFHESASGLTVALGRTGDLLHKQLDTLHLSSSPQPLRSPVIVCSKVEDGLLQSLSPLFLPSLNKLSQPLGLGTMRATAPGPGDL